MLTLIVTYNFREYVINSSHRRVYLTPPVINQFTVKERISCIRAHRERLFRIDYEQSSDKHLFHLYGHGGAGWTFLPGSINQSMRLFNQQAINPKQPIAVIGAGCYGLMSAIELARAGHSVTIYAQETQNITSFNAAGFFFPRHRKSSTPAEIAQFTQTGLESYQEYVRIIKGEHQYLHTGIQLLPAYYAPDIDPGFGPYIAHGIMSAPEEVIIDFNTNAYYHAMAYKSLFINAPILMDQLEQERKRLAIPIVITTVHSWNDLNQNIIFNCAGLGAKALTHDPKIIPVQGHLITLMHQPPIEQLQYMINFKVTQPSPYGHVRDELIYFAPKDNGILGITFKRGVSDPAAHTYEFDRLLERSAQFFGT